MSSAAPRFIDVTGFPDEGEIVPPTPRAAAHLIAGGWTPPDVPDKFVYAGVGDEIGGYVCSTCDMPVESEPCADHQPVAYARCNS